MQKYGIKRGKQRYKCLSCHHQFVISYHKTAKIKKVYQQYVFVKQTILELSHQNDCAIRTLQRKFDELPGASHPDLLFHTLINLIVDVTFFSRSDGVLIFRANKKNLHWRFVQSETLAEISQRLDELNQKGYCFQSVTLDGRKGIIKLFEARYPELPIQLCQFHQAQIIRRYTTSNPKTDCGRALKLLMRCLTEVNQEVFASLLETLREEYADFLKEKNEQKEFKHQK